MEAVHKEVEMELKQHGKILSPEEHHEYSQNPKAAANDAPAKP